MYSINDLAYFGGKPAFEHQLYVGKPNIGNRANLQQRINDILDKKWLTNRGPYVIEFEKKIAELHKVKHCIAMCNGTVALEIAIRAAGLKGEVILPAMTFIATAHALQWQEITPVFCDIDPITHNIDVNKIESLITPKTTGIIGVHLWGRPCNIERLKQISQKHNLKLLFDAAHALGCSYNNTMIGNFGDAEILSFHATKFINTLEGGAVLTNNSEIAEKVRLMQNFGFKEFDNVIYIGTNGKMDEISAAMGLTSLESIEHFIDINYNNYKHYKNVLECIPGIRMVEYNDNAKCNYQYIVFEMDETITSISRDLLINILWAENVIARRYFFPGCHKMEPYKSFFPHSYLLLPHTEELVKRIISLPTGTEIDKEKIEKICEIIRFSVEHSFEINDRIASNNLKDNLANQDLKK
jgi:dTDP-4-amino-4,6-dideoxygalactose transaminase